jgi:anti-sigma factor (TIGR02949 family)
MGSCSCGDCERLLQPYVDRQLSEVERAEVEIHLAGCSYCRRCYRLEEGLRGQLRKLAAEEMPPELKAKLAALRTPL